MVIKRKKELVQDTLSKETLETMQRHIRKIRNPKCTICLDEIKNKKCKNTRIIKIYFII